MTSAEPDYTAAYGCDEIEEQAALEQHGLQELLNIFNREFEYYKGAYQPVGTQVRLTWLALQIPPKSINQSYI